MQAFIEESQFSRRVFWQVLLKVYGDRVRFQVRLKELCPRFFPFGEGVLEAAKLIRSRCGKSEMSQ